MDLEKLKKYIDGVYRITSAQIEKSEKCFTVLARREEFDEIKSRNIELDKLDMLKSFLDALYMEFPELKS